MSKALKALEQYQKNPIGIEALTNRWVDGTQDKRTPAYADLEFCTDAVAMDFASGRRGYFAITFTDGTILHIEDNPDYTCAYENAEHQAADQGWQDFDDSFPAHPDFIDDDTYR